MPRPTFWVVVCFVGALFGPQRSPSLASAQEPAPHVDCTRDDDTAALLYVHGALLGGYAAYTLAIPAWQGEADGIVPGVSIAAAIIAIGAATVFMLTGCHSIERSAHLTRERQIVDDAYEQGTRVPQLVLTLFAMSTLAVGVGAGGAALDPELRPILTVSVGLGFIAGMIGLVVHHTSRMTSLRTALPGAAMMVAPRQGGAEVALAGAF